MKPSYTQLYASYSPLAPLRFLWDGLFTRSKLRKLSLQHRQQDYVALANDPKLLDLHRKFNAELLAGVTDWDSYDYGEGYFYQSCEPLHVSGLRDTRGRVETMNLREIVAGRSTLEIGANTGFVSLAIADVVPRLVGFDLNPHLVRIAQLAAAYLELENLEFSASSFEDFTSHERFGAVLSFANHKTYDGNTRISIEGFVDKCHQLLEPGGLLVFESHPPELEGDGLEKVCPHRGPLPSPVPI